MAGPRLGVQVPEIRVLSTEMDRHLRRLANLNIAFGVVGLGIGCAVLAEYGGISALYRSFTDGTDALLVTSFVLAQMLIAIPALVVAPFLKQVKSWARSVMVVVSTANVLNFPLGTALGCYGLWVLMAPETEPLFTDRPPGYPRRSPTGQVPDAGRQESERPSVVHRPPLRQS